jgi:O-antigen/teichoic acid export membrane protein
LSGVVARLTTANVLGAATGFISGPLLGRALGASGRGDLAAILVPLALVPGVLGLGIQSYAYRALPRGRRADEVIGSLGLPLLVIGLLTAAAAVPIADALAGGRETVRTFLIVGLVMTPLALIVTLLATSLAALERWRAVVAITLLPFWVPFIGIVVLYIAGALTVATAAAVTIAATPISFAPALPLIWSVRRPVFRPALARQALGFGLRSWVGGLAQLANLRLDQFLMITMVAPRVLGLYAVATTIAGAAGLATSALAPPLMTRIASGERQLTPRAVRITLAVTVVLNVVLALATPILLSVLFGPEFLGAVGMTLVLLVAAVPQAGASVLSSALQADGLPSIPSIGEGLALSVTVVGLLTLLRPLGGIGAALVSLAAYSTSFLFQLAWARRRLGLRLHKFLIPAGEDVRWARSLVSGMTPALR